MIKYFWLYQPNDVVYDRLLSQDSTVGHSPILYVQQWENDWNRGWNEHVVPENCVNGVNREDVKNLFYTKELVATEAGNTAYYLKHPLFFAQHVYLSWMGNQRNLKFPLDPFFVSPIMCILHALLGLQVGGGLSGVFHGCDLGDIGVDPPGVSGMKRGAQKWPGFLWDGIELWPNQCKTDL